ncbi:hypothetical protein ACFWVB_20090 [Streptomyces microflavus]|uniref:hypothetical protein n=1 Tax=Streptomyces microflavus TaxID=1919 RepID=UPI00364B820F
MPCAPCNKRKNQQFEVVGQDGTGKVLFTSGSKATADAVAKRYPGSSVRTKGEAPAAKPIVPAIPTEK